MWQEILAGALMSVDVFILFSLVTYRKQMIAVIALWTAFLHMLLPLVGYFAGIVVQNYLEQASPYLSGILLILVGFQMMLSQSSQQAPLLSPYLLAVLASMDTFSVSVSFGMLKLDRLIFIISSGLFSFFAVFIAQKIMLRYNFKNGSILLRLAGFVILLMGILTIKNIQKL